MLLKDVMIKNVITVTPDTPVSEVARILHEHKIHGIPVVDNSHLVGIITESDFFTKGEVEIHLPSYIDFLNKTGIERDAEELSSEEFKAILTATAKDIMTTECVTLSPNSDVKQFLTLVKQRNLHTLPITVGDILEGIVTVADIIKLL